MAVKAIKAKQLLSHRTEPDPWFGCKYTMNIYRGCQHQCIYCDSRSECYQIQNFKDVLYKKNAIAKLKKELSSKQKKGTICFGSMNDPYMPVERRLKLVQKSLSVIKEYEFPVHIMTKSDLVLRDKKIIRDISRNYAAISFTITTIDDDLAKRIEPGAPSSAKRFEAIAELARMGIYTGITMMPILPFVNDTWQNIRGIVEKASDVGAKYIIPCFGVTLRDRQRLYFYKKLDKLFPNVKSKYVKQFNDSYECFSPIRKTLSKKFTKFARDRDIETSMRFYEQSQLKMKGLR